jgi:hypothetical protein
MGAVTGSVTEVWGVGSGVVEGAITIGVLAFAAGGVPLAPGGVAAAVDLV